MKKYIFFILVNFIFIQNSFSSGKEIIFDDVFLESRGIDGSIAEQFSHSVVFLPGVQALKIYVNNSYRATVDVDISEQGLPCLNKELLNNIGVIVPFLLLEENTCLSADELWSNSEIIKKPNKQELWFFIPERFVSLNFSERQNYIYGGSGALLNYTANYMGGSGDIKNEMYYINTEFGINTQNWLFRSYQIYSHLSNSNFIHQYAYAQMTWEEQQKKIQLGQINLYNSGVGGARVFGIQFTPESILENNSADNAIVSGIASESSMVEIYQSGRLIYNTAVPAGFFEISNFSLINQTTDLHVRLKGVNGNEQTFIVPALTFPRFNALNSKGYSFGIGRYDSENASQHPLVASVSKSWRFTPFWAGQTGTELTSNYYSFGVGNNINLTNEIQLSANVQMARNQNNHRSGSIFSGLITYMPTETVSFSMNGLVQSRHFYYLSDSVSSNNEINNKQKQLGSDINWSTEIGSLSSSIGRTYTWRNQHNDYVNFSWSRVFFQNNNLSATFQRNYNADNVQDDALYVRLSIPFEHSNISTWMSNDNNSNRWGTRYNDYTARDRNWGVEYEYNDQKNYQTVSANIQTATPYTQIGGSIRRDNQQQTSWGGALSGGVAVVKEGILFSSYPVKDTFGIAKVGDVNNVRIDTPSGPTWTNNSGYALISSLNSYSNNTIKVDPRSLSRHNDILNAYKTVIPAKGSIVPLQFAIVTSRKVKVMTNIGSEPLPINSTVSDDSGNFLTLVTRPGQIFLGDVSPEMNLHVETPQKQHCVIQLKLPTEPELDVLYEEITELCY